MQLTLLHGPQKDRRVKQARPDYMSENTRQYRFLKNIHFGQNSGAVKPQLSALGHSTLYQQIFCTNIRRNSLAEYLEDFKFLKYQFLKIIHFGQIFGGRKATTVQQIFCTNIRQYSLAEYLEDSKFLKYRFLKNIHFGQIFGGRK